MKHFSRTPSKPTSKVNLRRRCRSYGFHDNEDFRRRGAVLRSQKCCLDHELIKNLVSGLTESATDLATQNRCCIMKLTRQKRFRRFLRFYQMNYGLEPPYVLIVDSDFIMAALRGKIHLKEQIPKLMQDRCFPRVSTCTMNMLKSRGEDCSGAFIVAKRFDRVQCGHAKNSTDEAACIADVLRKTTLGSSACAGVQNTDLRIRLRCQSYSIPILYISGQVPILEAPASIAVGKVKTKQAEDLQPLEWEKKSLGVETTNDASEPPRKKRKRAEPNPLSCKKKKPKVVPQRRPTADQTEHKPRRRRRKKHAASETQGTDEPTTATPDIIT